MNSRLRSRRSLVFLLATFLVAPLAAQESLPADLRKAVEQVDALLAAEWQKDTRGSVTIGVVVGDRLIWTRSLGHADIEKKTLATAESIYRIGSITKTVTAMALLQLVERGRVRLSDPVEKYFPEVNRVQGRFPDAPPITLVQLATMTAGLAREPENLPTHLVGAVADWERVLLGALPETRYVHEPGTRYLYSNIGYAILGAAIARAAGQPFTEFVENNILAPLKMSHTAFEPDDRIRPHIARGYAARRDSPDLDAATPEREHGGRGYKVPNGALYTTVGDLARYVSFLLGHGPETVLKRETLRETFSQRIVASTGNLGPGYGVGFLATRGGDRVFHGHGGSVAGYEASMLFDREAGIGVIALRNVGGGELSVSRLARQALQILVAARPQPQN